MKKNSYDLHVLSSPLAFILSQDRTLRFIRKFTKFILCFFTIKKIQSAFLFKILQAISKDFKKDNIENYSSKLPNDSKRYGFVNYKKIDRIFIWIWKFLKKFSKTLKIRVETRKMSTEKFQKYDINDCSFLIRFVIWKIIEIQDL